MISIFTQKFIVLIAISALFSTTTALAKRTQLSKLKESSKRAQLYSLQSLQKDKFMSWGIDPNFKKSSINLIEGWKIFKKQKNVVVAVVDTGIDPSHPYLKKNLYVVNKKLLSAKNFGQDFSTGKSTTTPIDSHGHGTHVAGIIRSVFPEVKILSVKYFNQAASGEENLKATIKSLEYAVNQNVDIINYSGGGPKASAEEKKILLEAERKGILIIAAAGNEKSNIDLKENAYFPASYGLSNIITVGAHNEFNQIISSSNWGQASVDIAAPGYRIKSSVPKFDAKYMTGTSQATAFVTGVAALIKSNYPNLNFAQIKNIIISSSRKMKQLKGKVLGGGKLDAARALEVAGQVYEKLYSPSERNTPNRSVAKKR